jgi:hypothetical protein
MNVGGTWVWCRAIPYLGIFVSNFRYCVYAVYHILRVLQDNSQDSDQAHIAEQNSGSDSEGMKDPTTYMFFILYKR